MKINNKFHNSIFTTLITDYYMSIMSLLLYVYKSCQDFSFTTSPHFCGSCVYRVVLLLFMCTGKIIYIKKTMTSSRKFCHSLLLFFKVYLVYYCRKGENKFKIPPGVCVTMNLLSTLQFCSQKLQALHRKL